MKGPLDRGALAREISALANGRVDAATRSPTIETRARRIAITGAPGAGKSTLAGHLARLRGVGLRYGILAVDPSSPRSGGAILGDRIRIDEIEGTADLYVRSLGSRSSNDGLSDHLPAILDAMDRHAFDEVLLETVGVGQADYAVRALVDTVVLVLHPESGDIVQAMKAGIMEMADVYVINKSDLPTAAKSAADIQRILSLTHREAGAWVPPVLSTSQKDAASIVKLSEAIDAHGVWRAEAGLPSRERAMGRYVLQRAIDRRVAMAIAEMPEDVATLEMPEQMRWVFARAEASADPSSTPPPSGGGSGGGPPR